MIHGHTSSQDVLVPLTLSQFFDRVNGEVILSKSILIKTRYPKLLHGHKHFMAVSVLQILDRGDGDGCCYCII